MRGLDRIVGVVFSIYAVVLVLSLLLLLVGCTIHEYEPAYCYATKTNIVGVTDSTVTYETRCIEWRAFSDSTIRWDGEGNKLP